MTIPSAQPKIAIIGGGAAGLACARIYSRAGLKPVVFEKDAVVGGIWQRVPGSRDRPMYKGLRTNLPKEIMAFREFPFPTTVNASFVTHQVVFDYLQSYAKHFELEQYIQTNCCVKQITVLSDQSAEGLVNESWKKIRIRWSDATCKDCATEDFDAVCVANGHYARPIIPLIDGIQHFTGSVMHSIEYDEPQIYADQRVLCVGGRASGSDLAREVAQYAKYVYLSDTTAPSKPLTKYNVTWVPKTTHVLEDGRICFHDCDEPVHFDTIIFCTGYDYEFPFVNDHSNLEIDAESRRVSPLYEQLWHAGSPNVAFLGLPHSVLPFPLFELQAEALLQQWVTKWTLPDATTLMTLAKSAASSGGEGKSNGRVPEDTHFLGDAQWDYCRRMAKYAGLYTDKMEDYLMTNQVRTRILIDNVLIIIVCRCVSDYRMHPTCFVARQSIKMQQQLEAASFLQGQITIVPAVIIVTMGVEPFNSEF